MTHQPSPPVRDVHIPPTSSTVALLSLTQDIAALISLSLESSASLIHDWISTAVGALGIASVVQYNPPPIRPANRGESGRGSAVVILGASEVTGQSLTLHLAKSGYTVFPFLPLPNPSSPPTSSALSTLLLAWSGMQKRLRARNPNHPGAVVPVMTDSENSWEQTPPNYEPGSDMPPGNGKNRGRFGHAGETVRAYCRENGLELVAVVCAARGVGNSGHRNKEVRRIGGVEETDMLSTDITTLTNRRGHTTDKKIIPTLSPTRTLSPLSLTMTNEQTLLSLYRTNVLDPLSVVRELADLLSSSSDGKGRGRVIFVGSGEMDAFTPTGEEDEHSAWTQTGAWRLVQKARGEMAKILRTELGSVGIDVCEVVVGPLSPRVGLMRYHQRKSSEDSTDSSEQRHHAMVTAADRNSADISDGAMTRTPSKEAILAQRLAFLSRIWAVDDALLYSAVRRAIEDRYPRSRHHAGLSPLLGSIAEITPGSGFVRMLGRWVLGRLLMPRGSRG